VRRSVPGWVLVVALVVTVLVGIGAYNAGVSEGVAQGLEEGGRSAELDRAFGPHRGFGFFPLGLLFVPLLFFGFFALMGALFGRGPRWGGPGPWGGGGYGSFEEWHRRQHERPGRAERTDEGSSAGETS
jgi:hypothetical protein